MPNSAPLFKVAWLAWALTWLLAAPWSARTMVRQPAAARLRHYVPLLLGGGLFLATTTPTTFLGRSVVTPEPWEPSAGLALTLLGLLFAAWARFTLGKLWSGRVTLKANHRLVQQGPYAITRHPIYTGLLLALLGTALARDTVAVALGLACITAAVVVKIRQEDELLAKHFGPAFDEYRHRVRTLIPGIW